MNLAYTFLIMAAIGLIGLLIAIHHFSKREKMGISNQ